jgi:hypothetical protein
MSLSKIMAAPMVEDLYGLAVREAPASGLFLEFGVGSGRSLRHLRRVIPLQETIYGFDSFDGLPEPWRNLPVGSFATSYRINLPNVVLVEGLFADTVPRFAKSKDGDAVALMHVDCDLYSSTRDVLTGLAPLIVPGTVMLFDELFGYEGWEEHEYRALVESGVECEVLARWDAFRAVVRVTR